MFSESGFTAFVRSLAKENRISHELAEAAALQIDDTPILDESGRAMVIIDGYEYRLIVPE